MTVDDAATLLRTTWETDATTVGGLVTAALGHLPLAGEAVAIGDFEFEVEQVAERAVAAVLARRVTSPTDEDAA
jgi:Mg2+/Co2+ transporter CorC